MKVHATSLVRAAAIVRKTPAIVCITGLSLLWFVPNAHAGLVGYWPLDGDLLDHSANSNDGSLINHTSDDTGSTTGGPEFDANVPAAIGGGMSARFDGIDDGIDLGNNGGLSGTYNFTTNDWTISGWIQKTAESSWVVFANGGNDAGGIRTNLWREGSGADTDAQLTVDNDITKVEVFGGTVDMDGTWHHVAATREGDAISLYVDGVLIGSNPLDAGFDLSAITQHNAYIGTNWSRNQNDLQNFTEGSIDDVAVFDTALSETQIALLASGDVTPLTVPEPQSLLLWGVAAMTLLAARARRGNV